MQPSMSNVIITASPPTPLLLERGVDSEVPYLLIIYLMRLFIRLICSIVVYKFKLTPHFTPLSNRRGGGGEA